MKRLRLVIDDKIPYLRGEAERIGETVYLPGASITADDVRRADALIVRTRTRCDRALLEGSAVRLIVTATIGFDHIDTDYLRTAGIAWTNCPGCNAGSVAQYVEAVLLLLEAKGMWNIPGYRPVVGIIGVGHVGSRVADRARRLGLRVLLCDPPRVAAGNFPPGMSADDFCSQETIEREADVITLHVPLTTCGPHATCHLADDAFFGRLARKPVFINTSRGEVADTQALCRALDTGCVRQAVIDTWKNEPRIDRGLLSRVLIGTPHIAGYSADGKANGTRMALEAVARHFGLPCDFRIQPPALPQGFRYDTRPDDDLAEAIPRLRLYDPRRDSRDLKQDPDAFERLRGNYPLRREHSGTL